MSFIEEDKNNITSGAAVITDGKIMYYDGGLESIKGRGNSSWDVRKKPYNIKLADKADLFGMGGAKKYALMAHHVDKSFIRNKLGMDIGDIVGVEYCMDSRYADLYINGEYRCISPRTVE